MTLSVQMAQAVALQDTTVVLLMCTHKQNFELVIGCPILRLKKDRGNSKLNELQIFCFLLLMGLEEEWPFGYIEEQWNTFSKRVDKTQHKI